MKIAIRRYRSEDCLQMARMFYDTVHAVNARDYSPEQLEAWAPSEPDADVWDKSFQAHATLVAEADGVIAGFADADELGYIDRLYVHREYQGQGVATALCDALEAHLSAKRMTVHASITARSFFERRGYAVVREQQVERRGVRMTNFLMEKIFCEREESGGMEK